MRPSNPFLPLLIGSSLLLATWGYYEVQGYQAYLSPERIKLLGLLAQAYFALLFLGLGFIIWWCLDRLSRTSSIERGPPLSWRYLIPYVLTLPKYKRVFWLASLGYALFYAFLTGIIVYRPDQSFSQLYGVRIPSAIIIPAFGPPGLIPVLVVYVTDNLGLLLLPLGLFLLLTISPLVGLNSALMALAYALRPRGGKGWPGIMGAMVGLFTGCPTCAGLFLASALGWAGAAEAAILGSYQPIFIALALPALLASPLFMAKALAKALRGCAIDCR